MKKFLALALMTAIITTNTADAQTTAKKSPAVTVSQTIKSGATITIAYGQPSLNGRTIGTDVEPKIDKVWRMGANEATTFETNKEITLDGHKLPAGKYSVFGIAHDNTFTLIFNKEWKMWGTQYTQHRDKDALSFVVKKQVPETASEKLTYAIDKDGKISMVWGDMAIAFFAN
jgi:hypothetical protein